MIFSADDLTQIALDLNSGISTEDRFARLLHTIREVIRCDASALLAFQGEQFRPLAIDGLSPDVLGRRFLLADHPRLEIIARAGDVVRFPADSDLPDPYDGLIPNQGDRLKVHSCIGLPLRADDCLIGALTIDGFDDVMFDGFGDEDLRTLSALAAASLNNALLMEQLEKPAAATHSVHDLSPAQPTEMIGESATMLALKKEIEIVSGSGLNVLILGETGVGKELVAQEIHNWSPRQNKPLVYLNCAALPESIAESELFGHVKGAFTGAISNRKGKFESADAGTLFLDEIGELPLLIQAKLLRVLQYGELQRIGDDRVHRVDVRIIAATNKDLKREVVAGHFRADLFHRLSVFPLQVPPLRDREDDIPLLTGFFVEKCRVKLGLSSLRIHSSAMRVLSQYDWPGNVRELEHSIARAAIVARAESGTDTAMIDAHHFDISSSPADRADSAASSYHVHCESLRDATDAFQRLYIENTVKDSLGNWADAARALKVDSGNLHRLAKRLGLKQEKNPQSAPK
ncbi:MAG: nitric oxide reductase transcriptional regulator NorR [Halieaceae bacterium]|jgi:anaerobic nitric oxide reductase transcription regulator|nr:nitric oxide reductase transcriptional regulator NorR [Halieaceae bacterium]